MKNSIKYQSLQLGTWVVLDTPMTEEWALRTPLMEFDTEAEADAEVAMRCLLAADRAA